MKTKGKKKKWPEKKMTAKLIGGAVDKLVNSLNWVPTSDSEAIIVNKHYVQHSQGNLS